jgi:hypothetical protein
VEEDVVGQKESELGIRQARLLEDSHTNEMEAPPKLDVNRHSFLLIHFELSLPHFFLSRHLTWAAHNLLFNFLWEYLRVHELGRSYYAM